MMQAGYRWVVVLGNKNEARRQKEMLVVVLLLVLRLCNFAFWALSWALSWTCLDLPVAFLGGEKIEEN